MENFQFCVPTNVFFGKGQIEQLPEVMKEYGKNVLLVYGGGSIKRLGIYDKILSLLPESNIIELEGIARNPRIDKVREGARLCEENQVDVILAVGGGSVLDSAKAIAVSAAMKLDAWKIISEHLDITAALPIVAVPTVAATGSETDSGAVISNPETNEKLSFMSPLVFPKAAILDPTYTFSIPASQTAAGSADILSHLMEQYFVAENTMMSDLLVESVMKTVIHYTPIALREPDNYEARAQLLWASNIADNATLCNGNRLHAFGVHGMEHEFSAFYDMTHGVGLSILTPRWMRHVLSEQTAPRFAHFAKAVWGVEDMNDNFATAREGIKRLEDFLKSLGIPMTLGELGINDRDFEAMAKHAVEHEWLAYAWVPLTEQDVISIYRNCL
ncbi:MAG: iron-containing alcohol dehydrogenase [Prevotella sp.]|nr:iron-containing alcohol dehydrogenase [Prevotella sp.]